MVVMDCPEGGVVLIGSATGRSLLQPIKAATSTAGTIDCFNIVVYLDFIKFFFLR
jgi:hypothetical protein